MVLPFPNRQMVSDILLGLTRPEMQNMLAWSKRRQHHPPAIGHDGLIREVGRQIAKG